MNAPQSILAPGIEINVPISPAFAEILTPAAMLFAARLQRGFGARRDELLATRAERHGLLSLADPCPEILLARIAELVDLFEADEVVVLLVAPDYGERLKSYELLARAQIVA